jgi:hypothetical protein
MNINIQLQSFPFLLFLIFFALKITGVINWSWWAVTSPIWITALIMAFVLVLGVLLFILNAILQK